MQIIWSLRFDKIVRYFVSRERRGQKRERKTSLSMFPKHSLRVLVDLLKGKLQDQDRTSSLRSVHLSMWKKIFLSIECTLCLDDYENEGIFLRVIIELQNQASLIFFKTFESNKRMQYSLWSFPGEGNDG